MIYAFNGRDFAKSEDVYTVELGIDERRELQLNLGRADVVVMAAQILVLLADEPDLRRDVEQLIEEAEK